MVTHWVETECLFRCLYFTTSYLWVIIIIIIMKNHYLFIGRGEEVAVLYCLDLLAGVAEFFNKLPALKIVLWVCILFMFM